MNKIKIGDRVTHSFLGEGVVDGETEFDYLVSVNYDKRPPYEYNLGVNPTAELVSRLELIK